VGERTDAIKHAFPTVHGAERAVGLRQSGRSTGRLDVVADAGEGKGHLERCMTGDDEERTA
jgi:two-component sensor histidine kinase